MAKKKIIELKHGEDLIKWDIPVDENAAEKHIARIESSREKRFENYNMQMHNEMLGVYNTYSEQFRVGTEDEQIMLLNRFHQLSEFSAWIIGDFLLIIEDKIEKEHVKMTKGRYNSLRDYFDINKNLLGFSYQAGYNYIKIRKGLTIDEFKRIGVKKGVAVATAPEELKERLIQEIMDNPKMTEEQVKLDIAKYRENLSHAKKVEKQEEQKKIAKTIKYDILTNKGADRMTIDSKSFPIELMQDAIFYFEMQIKAYIKRRLENE